MEPSFEMPQRKKLGTTERTNHGCYFADAADGTPLGVYASKTAAQAALMFYAEHGVRPGLHIKPQVVVGPPPQGMTQ